MQLLPNLLCLSGVADEPSDEAVDEVGAVGLARVHSACDHHVVLGGRDSLEVCDVQ